MFFLQLWILLAFICGVQTNPYKPCSLRSSHIHMLCGCAYTIPASLLHPSLFPKENTTPLKKERNTKGPIPDKKKTHQGNNTKQKHKGPSLNTIQKEKKEIVRKKGDTIKEEGAKKTSQKYRSCSPIHFSTTMKPLSHQCTPLFPPHPSPLSIAPPPPLYPKEREGG